MKLNAVIIEDEPRAATRLEKLIASISEDIVILAKLESVAEGIEFFKKNQEVDLIFSDIQLADDLSFSIFRNVEISAPVIFTTAFDTYAIDAFKANGIDYLLKPIAVEELEKALLKFETLKGDRAKSQINLQDLAALLNTDNRAKSTLKSRFMVKIGTQIKSIAASDVVAAYSQNKATYLFTNQKRSYPLEQTLDVLAEQLDSERFFRINRGYLVSLDANPEIISYSNSRLKLIIPGLNDHEIIVARERTKEFKLWLGGSKP